MNRTRYLTFVLLTLFIVISTNGCSSLQSTQPSLLDAESELVERPEPPEEFAGLTNPLAGDAQAIAEGAKLYQANCSSCHGASGQGDGPAAGGLEPKPRNLAMEQSSLDDAYLFWRISEGGLMEPFRSVMPAWKGLLDEQQIWQIISFLRTLPPQQ